MPHETSIAVVALDEASRKQATALSRATDLPFIAPDKPCDSALQLCLSASRIYLIHRGEDERNSIDADWLGADIRRRLKAGKKQLLARAVGLRRPPHPTLLDATAGLGRDGVVLAALGAQVTLCERHPLIYAMLLDAERRARTANKSGRNLPQAIVALEAKTFMHDHPGTFDVVYLDPMYASRGKSALPKKALQALRTLVGGDQDADDLLPAARACARQRVVVKRHPAAPPLSDSPPDLSFSGTRARYDVYLRRNHEPVAPPTA